MSYLRCCLWWFWCILAQCLTYNVVCDGSGVYWHCLTYNVVCDDSGVYWHNVLPTMLLVMVLVYTGTMSYLWCCSWWFWYILAQYLTYDVVPDRSDEELWDVWRDVAFTEVSLQTVYQLRYLVTGSDSMVEVWNQVTSLSGLLPIKYALPICLCSTSKIAWSINTIIFVVTYQFIEHTTSDLRVCCLSPVLASSRHEPPIHPVVKWVPGIYTKKASWLFIPFVPIMTAGGVMLPESRNGAAMYRSSQRVKSTKPSLEQDYKTWLFTPQAIWQV